LTADASRSLMPESFQQSPAGDLAALHAREADRLLAYLCSCDRSLGLAEAEAVCQQAFLEVRGSWPGIGPYSRPEVCVFAVAQRITSGRPRSGPAGDALTESAPDYWDRADVARLTVLQDCLDRLSPVPRAAVLLREMSGFSGGESAEIIGLPEPAVESARGDALRTLVPLIEAGTAAGTARRGPLSPEDFAALGRVLQHTDPRRIEERQRFAMSLAQPPAMVQGSFPSGPMVQQPAPMTAVFTQPAQPAFGAGAPQAQQPAPHTAVQRPVGHPAAPPTVSGPTISGPTVPRPGGPGGMPAPPVTSAPPTSMLGSGLSGDALFAPTGSAPAPGDGPGGGWMGGFSGSRPGAPTSPSGARPSGPMTGSLSLGAPGSGGFGTLTPGAPGPGGQPPSATVPFTPGAQSFGTPGRPVVPNGNGNGSGWGASYPSSPPSGTPNSGSGFGGPTSLMPTGMRPGTTPLDAPGMPLGDAGLVMDTPIFDSVSAWFSAPPALAKDAPEHNGRSHPAASHWASLQDRGWREANARAAAGPQVAGNTSVGLPVRAPGANMVPSAADVALGMSRSFSRQIPKADPGRVRNRLDSFQQGVQTARQLRDAPPEPQPDEELFDEPAPRLRPAERPVERVVERSPERPVERAPERPAARTADVPPAREPAREPSHEPDVEPASSGRREGGFGVFYRDYLPHLLALLMVEGARPAVAAQLAQDAMSEAYREWAQLDNPREWTRQVALSTWAVQRRAGGNDAPPEPDDAPDDVRPSGRSGGDGDLPRRGPTSGPVGTSPRPAAGGGTNGSARGTGLPVRRPGGGGIAGGPGALRSAGQGGRGQGPA